MKIFQYVLFGIVGLMSTSVLAQWQWIDQAGYRVFSDRAPPSEVEEKNILKRPAVPDAKKILPLEAAVSAASTSGTVKIKGVDKELMEKKKLAEQAEMVKRQAEQERVLKTKVENCALAKQARANFDSGMRMARANEKGEREALSDSARAAEINRLQAIIDADCH